MLKPLTLLLCLCAPALQAQPLTRSEVTAAQTACAITLTRTCLFTLAQDAALNDLRPDHIHFHLTAIAMAQARAGDITGAERSMTLGPLDTTSVLLALGRWDQAYAAAKPYFPNYPTGFGTGEGSFKWQMVDAMLEQGQTALALQTALSITNTPFDEADIALKSIIEHNLDHNDFAAAGDLLTKIQSQTWRNHALHQIALAEAKAGRLTEATATLAHITPPDPRSASLATQAQALVASGNTTRAQHLLIRAARPPLTLHPSHQPDWDHFTSLAAQLVTLAQGPDPTATAKATQDLTNFLLDRRSSGLGRPFNDMVQDLIDQGTTQTAIDLMARLDHSRTGGGLSHSIAKTLLAQDKTIAPALLPLIETPDARQTIAQSWAETLHAQNRVREAQTVLTDLVTWLDSRPADARISRPTRVTILAAIAGSQRKLGFATDADATLTGAYSLTSAIKTSFFRVEAYVDIAAALDP